jgi:hypothetical protein
LLWTPGPDPTSLNATGGPPDLSLETGLLAAPQSSSVYSVFVLFVGYQNATERDGTKDRDTPKCAPRPRRNHLTTFREILYFD